MRRWSFVVLAACGAAEPIEAIDTPVDARARTDAFVPCAGYERLSGIPDVHYKGYRNRASWVYARSRCEYDGARLVVIDDAVEAAAVIGFVPADPSGAALWTGVVRGDAGWENAANGHAATYLPWAEDEPAPGAACAGLAPTSELRAGACTEARSYVCECAP